MEALIPGYGETGHGRYIDSQSLLDLPAVRKAGEEIRIELSLNPTGQKDQARGSGSPAWKRGPRCSGVNSK